MLGLEGISKVILGLSSTMIFLMIVGIPIVSIILLWLATKLLKFEKHDIKTAIIVTVIAIIPSIIIPPIGWLINIWLIRYFYKVKWRKAILAWLIVFVACFVIFVIPLTAVIFQPVRMILSGIPGTSITSEGSYYIISTATINLVNWTTTTNGEFKGVFVNAGDSQTNITSVNIINDVSGACSNIKIDKIRLVQEVHLG